MLMGLKTMCTLSLTADELLIACVQMLLIDFGRESFLKTWERCFIRRCVIKAHNIIDFMKRQGPKKYTATLTHQFIVVTMITNLCFPINNKTQLKLNNRVHLHTGSKEVLDVVKKGLQKERPIPPVLV